MIRPLTCVCLILAAGSGLYLYQVKQRAFALDVSLRSTFHDIDAARDRTRMLRADWALVNDPERLQALASQYLTLQPMQPSQLLTMDQLASALPLPGPFPAPVAPTPSAGSKPAPLVDPTHGLPMAEAMPQVLPQTSPAMPRPAAPQVALLEPATPQPAEPQPATPQPAAPQPAASLMPAPEPAGPATTFPASLSIPQLPSSPAPAPHLVPQPSKPLHHGTRHSAPLAQPWLAQTNGSQPSPHRHGTRHATPASRQFYATNVPQSGTDAAPRITPEAATVMYRPSSGSSLGMASSAELAPPRPLYSTSQ